MVLDVQVTAPPVLQINLMDPPVPRLESELVAEIDEREHDEQDVGVNKSARVEWREGRPALDQGEDNVCSETEPGVVRVPQGFKGELRGRVALGGPRLAEANVRE